MKGWCLALIWACMLLVTPAQADQAYPFTVDLVRYPDGHHIIGRNGGPAPVSVRVALVGTENLAPDSSWPRTAVVPAHGSLEIGQVRPADVHAAYRVGTRVAWMPGDFSAEPDPNARYRLPYPDGETFTIGQAPGGPIVTHNTPDSTYAVDIPMPEGAPIVAARDGVVVDTEAVQSEGGASRDMLDKANSVRILHTDGSIAVYAHLAYGSVSVYRGQQVSAGQEIGHCGSTGFSTGPHLHFVVQRLAADAGKGEAAFAMVAMPFQFYVGDPPQTFAPRYGLKAKADYSASAKLPELSGSSRYNSAPVSGENTSSGTKGLIGPTLWVLALIWLGYRWTRRTRESTSKSRASRRR